MARLWRRVPLRLAPVFLTLALFSGLWASGVSAAGFEKAVLWSGRYGGLAGAAAADVSGAEALYFNPAGLAARPGGQAVLAFSPTFGKPQGQLPSTSPALPFHAAGSRSFIPAGGALVSYGFAGRWGIGVGHYAVGGLSAVFSSLDYRPIFPSSTLRPTIRAKLDVAEMSLGAAYEVAPGLRLGAAWRVTTAIGDLSSVQILSPGSFLNVHFTGLGDTRWGGVKLGAQYEAPGGGWGAGLVWRSAVGFRARGNASGQVDAAGSVTSLPPGTVSIGNSLPQQVSLGGFRTLSRRVRLFAQYTWTEYSRDRMLDVTGSLGPVPLGAAARVEQHWRDMHVVRLGVERSGVGAWTLRAGYAYTSRVTAHEYARVTFVAPGAAHTFTLGGGRALSDRLTVDTALEYAFASGTGSNADDRVGPGSFRTDSVALHSGVTYSF